MTTRRQTLAWLAAAAWARPGGGGGLEGTVKDEKGHPVAGATVKVRHVVRLETLTATTDAAGVYVLEPLDPGTYSLFVSKKGYCAVWFRHVHVTGSGRTRKDVVLPSDAPCPVP